MILVAPLGIVWFAAVLLAVLDGRQRWVGWLAVGAIGASLVASVVLTVTVIQDGPIQLVAGGWPVGVGITLRADALGVTFLPLSVGVVFVATLYEVIGGSRSRVFPSLMCFLTVGLTGLFLTGDAFNFYVFFEIAMIAAYILSGYGERNRQLRAATIFITVNLLGSVLFLMSIAALYRLTGTLEMRQIASRIPEVVDSPAILTSALIFVAFSVKLGLFPFHYWLVAVYTGTRPAVAAVLSGALANIGGYGLLRFGGMIMPVELEFGAPVLLVLGSISIVYGAIQAISCGQASEVLGYSSIGQVGYIMIALAIGGEVGFTAAILFAIVNSANKALLFLTVPLRGQLAGIAFAIGAFSVAGVPPAVGFFGKVGLFQASVADDKPAIIALLFLGSALSFVYLFQLYNRRFWTVPTTGGPQRLGQRAIVAVVAVLIIGLGVWPEPLLILSDRAADVLINGVPVVETSALVPE